MKYQADLSQARAFLFRIIEEQADEKAFSWLKQQRLKLENEPLPRHFYLSFSTASRFFKKQLLLLNQQTQNEANQLRKGFQPATWDLLQTARTYLILLFPHEEENQWLASFQKFFETADMHEQQTLYAALPLLPYPKALTPRAAEGIRTNITSVFDAVALHNPYPADYLSEEAWNQMVLKAVFLQRPLYKIYGADERANPRLAQMLLYFAHERWAAGRKVMPELWRWVAPFLNEDYFQDVKKVVQEGEPLEKEGALLACSQSPLRQAKELLDQYPQIKEKIKLGEISWQHIGERSLQA